MTKFSLIKEMAEFYSIPMGMTYLIPNQYYVVSASSELWIKFPSFSSLPSKLDQNSLKWASVKNEEIVFYIGFYRANFTSSSRVRAPTKQLQYSSFSEITYNSVVFCFYSTIHGAVGLVKVGNVALGTGLRLLEK